jgi:hypothetical protein
MQILPILLLELEFTLYNWSSIENDFWGLTLQQIRCLCKGIVFYLLTGAVVIGFMKS